MHQVVIAQRTSQRGRVLAGLLAACAAALLGGCFSARHPVVRVTGVSLVQPAIAGVGSDAAQGTDVLSIDVLVENPSDKPLPLQRVTYDLRLEGGVAYTGERDAQATVRAFGTQTFTLPAPIRAGVVTPGQTPFSVSGSVVYIPPEVYRQTLQENGVTISREAFAGEGVVGAPKGESGPRRFKDPRQQGAQ